MKAWHTTNMLGYVNNLFLKQSKSTHNLQEILSGISCFFLAIHIIVPIFLTGRKNDIFFDDFIYQTIIFSL